MQSPSKSPLAGGFAIAILAIIGGFTGSRMGQPSLGLLVGVAVGIVIALIVWAIDRR